MAASCQGAPSSSPPSAFAAASGMAPSSAVAPALASSDSRPEKKPLSQARCSSEKGADSGIMALAADAARVPSPCSSVGRGLGLPGLDPG